MGDTKNNGKKGRAKGVVSRCRRMQDAHDVMRKGTKTPGKIYIQNVG